MKLIRAQYMHDGSKVVFYFSADGRVDFRDLVKDLAHRFRTRIEMHQIGVRDGARMLGGIGPCGRELCCSTFLESFAPVSIRMAKSQGLTLNPRKVSGMCGRLMCCLVYEQQLYKRQRRRMPRPDTEVHTELGPGTITSVDVINERVTVELRDTNRHTLPLAEVSFEEPDAHTVDRHAAPPPIDYDWDDDENAGSSKDDAKEGEPSKDDSSSEGAQKKRAGRRSRRRRSRRRDKKDEKG